ncbi:SRPBCC domain-containing protein [uncultured Cellulomonas sp.]|uniref:SRPBCC domain-containing protein n=1 Tax=uncultured Cellulomonas sp. TaxID=189682 RepID=UPI00261D719E|nr:SRPBCC domain-containing protein [uncultured Cellulomonas sp.]
MTDGTLLTIDGRPALRFERVLPHSVHRVWQAVSVPAELALWFPAAAPWTPATGEHFEVGGMTGQVTEARPPHRLAWTFAGAEYSFDLAEHDDGCRLVFVHVFDDRSAAAQTAAGWHSYLSRLQPHLAGERVSEDAAHRGWAQTHERYAEAFGVDPAPGRHFAEQLRTEQA